MIADGKVVIDVILDDGSVVKGVANIDKELGGLKSSSERAAISIGSIATALGLVAIASSAINMVKNALDGAIERYDTLSNFPRVLEQMGFDAEESERAINKLSDGIQGLPTTLDSVAKTAQRIAIMTGDLDGAVETTLALNNAFISSGASQQDAARGLEQYVQMLAKGEVDLQSWRTLQETMGVALNETANSFGFAGRSAQNDLYEALKEGHITFDQFNAKLIELSNAQGGFAERALTAAGGIRTAYTNMRTAVVRGLTTILESIDSVLENTSFESIENIIVRTGQRFNAVLTWMAKQIPIVMDRIIEMYRALEPWLPLIKAITIGITSFITAFATINTVVNIVNSLRLAIIALNTALLSNPITLVAAAMVAAVTLIYFHWEPIKKFFIGLWNWMKDFFSEWGLTLLAIIAPFIGVPILIWKNWDELKAKISNLLNQIGKNMRDNFEKMKKFVTDKVEEQRKKIVDTWDKVVSFFKGIDLKQIGKDIIQGLIDGVVAMTKSLIDKVKGIADSIKNTIKGALGIHSPSRVMMGFGEDVGEGMALGIEKSLKLVDQMSNRMAMRVIPVSGAGHQGGSSGAGASTVHAPQTIYVQVDAKDLQQAGDVVRLFQNLQQVNRQGV